MKIVENNHLLKKNKLAIKHFGLVISLCMLTMLFNSRNYAQDTLTLDVQPYLSSKELTTEFNPLVNYLSKKLDMVVQLKIGNSFQDQIENVGKDKFDIAFMGPVSFIEMVNSFGTKRIIGTISKSGKPFYKGKIIVNSNSKIETLNDLKGKSIAFVNNKSASGYMVPMAMMIKHGIELKDFKEYKYLNSHTNVMYGILTGDFDAGCVIDQVYDKFKLKNIRVLAETPFIYDHVFVVSNSTSSQLYNKIQKIMLAMGNTEIGRKTLASINPDFSTILKSSLKDYYNLKKIIETVNNDRN